MARRRATSEPPTLRRSARILELATQQEASNATPENGISIPVPSPLKRKRDDPQTGAAKSGAPKKQPPKGKATQKGKVSTRGLPPSTKISKKLGTKKPTKTRAKANAPKRKTASTKSARKPAVRSKQTQKYTVLKSKDNAPQELPHNLGPAPGSFAVEVGRAPASELHDSDKENQALKDENVSSVATGIEATDKTAAAKADGQKANDGVPKKEKAKRPSYKLTPGKTPYEDWERPTPQECELVNRLLTEVHGEAKPPPKLQPSLTVAGCGEVPCVLDALIRTLLSGATSGNNSALAFDGLVKRFGILQEGVGKGSVNWDAVRQAPLQDVFEAIKRGGLADIKSKHLKAILDKVYEENLEQRKRVQANDGSFDEKHPGMAPEKAEKTKEYEVACVEQHVLSLNHLHDLPTEEVMNELTKYPGIGPKTAACVILFCLQRPCFAVDTHIFRICKWLGWVPEKANEVMAFKHLEVRIPDEFKYSLHQLFIRHGKTCPRCRAITGEKSAGWEEGCPIDDLVQRTGVRKGGVPQKAKGSRKSLKRKRKSPVKKTVKRKATGKKATTAKKNPPRKTRAQKKSTAPEATAPEAASSAAVALEDTSVDVKSSEMVSAPAANQEDITIPPTPTPVKNGASDTLIPENHDQGATEQGSTEAEAEEETESELTDLSDDDSDDEFSGDEAEDETDEEEEWSAGNEL